MNLIDFSVLSFLKVTVREPHNRPRRNPLTYAMWDTEIRWVLGRRPGPSQGVWGTRRDPKQPVLPLADNFAQDILVEKVG